MKRLFQISFNILLSSVAPILIWIILGIIIAPDIADTFSLTFPLQFFYMVFSSIFAVGPNITARRHRDKHVVTTNMLVGVALIGLMTLAICLNIDPYITFMSMDPAIFHDFAIYSIIITYLWFIMEIVLQKLYYNGREKLSNLINTIYILLNFALIIILSATLTPRLAIIITLTADGLFVLGTLCANFRFRNFKFSLQLKNNLKYTSFDIIDHLAMMLIYGIGFRNAFSYGQIYITAINFEALVTDTQWDITEAPHTLANVDITKHKFNYQKSLKNAYALTAIILGSTALMTALLWHYYQPEPWIVAITLAIEAADFLLYPFYLFKLAYLQINRGTSRYNLAYGAIMSLRILCSFIPSAFCTFIGQLATDLIFWVYTTIKCRKIKAFRN